MIKSGITARTEQRFLKFLSAPCITIPSGQTRIRPLLVPQKIADFLGTLAAIIQGIAFKHTFYGYRRIHLAINRRGINANSKRVYRIYKCLSLQRQKPRKNKKRIVVQMPLNELSFAIMSGP